MLVTLNETLKLAEEKNIALGGFNITNLESLRSVLGAAEKLQLPVVLMFAQIHAHLIPLSLIGPILVRCAEEAGIPVAAHLDHGADLEYLKQALDMGFTSIMYDGSQLPYEENLENTRKAVELAAKYGASVEAELGTMGKREVGDGSAGGENNRKIYTDPALAAQFIRESGIDALACSFGTTHGIYLTKPKLDLDIVRQIRELTDGFPIVMHGGSGVSEEDYRRCIAAGVRKINYFTYMDKAGGSAAKAFAENIEDGKPVFFSDVINAAQEGMEADVEKTMRVFANL
jgi:fructose-bisphosphate aldolase class II